VKYFRLEEFNCTHTGKGGDNMDPEFLENLDRLREICGFPFRITSGYRDSTHPVEAKKEKPGYHAQGLAADIKVSNSLDRLTLVREALKMDCFNGIGIGNGFCHLDGRKTTPVMWTYYPK